MVFSVPTHQTDNQKPKFLVFIEYSVQSYLLQLVSAMTEQFDMYTPLLFTTPVTDDVPRPTLDPAPLPPPDLGTAFYICNALLNALLAAAAILLNSTVMGFHKGHLKDTVRFTYFTLSTSDLMTGICAALHALVFALLLVPRVTQGSAAMFCLVTASYLLTVISFRVSCFVSLVFAMIRTVNIVWPFRRVNHKLVVAAILSYAAVWVAVFASEIVVLVKTIGDDVADVLNEQLSYLMIGYFYNPSKFKLIDYVIRSSDSGLTRAHTAELCAIQIAYTAVPVTRCARLAGAAALLQLHTLGRRRRSDPNWSDNNKRSVTITLITLAFVLCSSTAICQPIYYCLTITGVVGARDLELVKQFQLFYLLGYTPFFVNAALNPLIFAMRVRVFKEWLRDKLGMMPKIGDGPADSKMDRRTTVGSQITSISRCNSGDSQGTFSQGETNF